MQAEPHRQSFENTESTHSWFVRGLFALAILLTCGLIMSMNDADPDLWGHVLYGQEMIEQGTLPRTTTWSFTANGYRWINHENFAELCMALADYSLGSLGLSLGKYVLGFVLIGLIWWRARASQVSSGVAAFVCLVVAFTVQFHWHFRPQIFGYVFFGIMCGVLDWCFVKGDAQFPPLKRLRHLFWLLPLATVWANTHGSFAAGICIAVASLGLRFLELALPLFSNHTIEVNTRVAVTKVLCLLPIVAGGMCLSTLLTPYGSELHLWLWGALRESRPEIGDWEALSLFSLSREVIGFWVIVVSTLLASRARSRTDWVRLIVFGLTALQAVSHIRHLPLLAILWGIWYAVDLQRIWYLFLQDLAAHRTQAITVGGVRHGRLKFLTHPLLLPTCLAVWVLGVGIATWPRLANLNVSREKYPVAALNFMAEQRLEGRTVVTFNWAQYAIGFFANEKLDSKVAFDGRFRTCYPQEVIDIYFDFIFGTNHPGPRNRSPRSGAINPEFALIYKNPELFLISRKQAASVRTMESHSADWVLLYQDELAQVWGRRDVFDSRESPQSLSESLRRDVEEQNLPPAAWPAFASRSGKSRTVPQLAWKR